MNYQSAIIGLFALVAGLPMFFVPGKKRAEAVARIANRKAELSAGADESFFEEARTIDAYPPPKTERAWRIRGAVLTLVGIASLVLAFIKHP